MPQTPRIDYQHASIRYNEGNDIDASGLRGSDELYAAGSAADERILSQETAEAEPAGAGASSRQLCAFTSNDAADGTAVATSEYVPGREDLHPDRYGKDVGVSNKAVVTIGFA
jgi:hypothetical protein